MLRGMPELSPAQREALGALLNAAPFAGVVRDLGRRFAERGHELYLVGGTVRDALLDRAPPDVDLTTDATPDQILAVVRAGRWSDGVWLQGVRYPFKWFRHGQPGQPVRGGGGRMPDTTKMSRAEAGRKGGQTTKKRYGDDFFGKIGRMGGKKGGETTKQRYGIEFYQKIGRKGGSR